MELYCDINKYSMLYQVYVVLKSRHCPPFLPGEMPNPEAADQSAALEGNGDDNGGEDDSGDDDACSQQSYQIGGRMVQRAIRYEPELEQLLQDELCPTEVPSAAHDESYEDLDGEQCFSILNRHVFSKTVPLGSVAFQNFGT